MDLYVVQHQHFEDSYVIGVFSTLHEAMVDVYGAHASENFRPTTGYIIERHALGERRQSLGLIHEPATWSWDVNRDQWWANNVRMTDEEIIAILDDAWDKRNGAEEPLADRLIAVAEKEGWTVIENYGEWDQSSFTLADRLRKMKTEGQ